MTSATFLKDQKQLAVGQSADSCSIHWIESCNKPDASTFPFESSLGWMVVRSNIDNPEKLAAALRHMPVSTTGFRQ